MAGAASAAQDRAIDSEEAGLTLQHAVAQVIAWHPSVEEAVENVRAQGEEIEVAKAGYQPQISGGIGAGYDRNAVNRWRPRANLNASQMLYDFGKVSSDVRITQAGSRISNARLLLAVDNLVRDTGYAVIESQRAAALQRVAAEQLTELRAIETLVRYRFQRGAGTRSDALQAQARVNGAETTLQQIEAERDRWRSNLAHLLGKQTVAEVEASVPLWLDGTCARDKVDWADVPAIMEAQAQRDQASAAYDRSRSERLPVISVEAGASTELQDPLSRRADYNVGLRVTAPISNGGATSARARGAGYSLRAATAAEARVRNDISRLLTEAQQQVTSFEQIKLTLAARERDMRETGSLYRLQYLEMGTRTLVDLLNAQQELHQARFDQTNTEHDLRRLQIDCLYYSGAARRAFSLQGQNVRGVTL